MNVPLLVAGCLGIVGAAIHGVGGELLVVRNLSPEVLPSSRFGGSRMTQAMIHVTWHLTTIAFLVIGGQLVAAGAAIHGDPRRALANRHETVAPVRTSCSGGATTTRGDD